MVLLMEEEIKVSTNFVHKDVPCKDLHGRRIILSDYTEKDLNEDTIAQILTDKFNIHESNINEYNYLDGYYRGIQPILGKSKVVRENINHIVLENNAFFAVEFKKAYVFGEPIQYVQRGDSANNEVLVLNSYMLAEDKQCKDSDLAEWLYKAGVCPRIILSEEENEESPFSIYNLDPRQSFVVYNNGLGNKPLFGVTYFENDEGQKIGSVYTKDKVYNIKGDSAKFDVEFKEGHLLGRVPILEYTLNKSRMGIIEVVISLLDVLNDIDSNDMDAIDQFVQSLVVFVNNDVDAETFKELMELGAVKVKTENPGMPADVKLLTNDLSHADTKVYYDRIYNQMLTIVGIPSKNDKASGGDTGQARLLGEGWTMADERAKQDENSFKRTAREELKLILDICKGRVASGITQLNVKDVDIKFTRNKTDNMLVKAQTLVNLKSAQVAPDIAMTVCGLFSDPNETYYKSKDFYGDKFWNGKDNEPVQESPLENPAEDNDNTADNKEEE